MPRCPRCEGDVANEHRFCPWCGAAQRLKLVQFFPPHPAIPADRDKMLRVSCYLGATGEERHVRFSVWDEEGVAQTAVSLDEAEARRLAAFVSTLGRSPPNRLGAIVAQLRADVGAAFTLRR
jgi:hypothetical protein